MKKRKGLKFALFLISLMVFCTTARGNVVHTYAGQEELLKLNSKNPEENIPFQMLNMFPGDSKSQNYRVEVTFEESVSIHLEVGIGEGDVKLAEVLQAKIVQIDKAEVLYEGLLKDLTVKHELSGGSNKQTQELFYEITISMGTDVGNEYQNLRMPSVDLVWWLEAEDVLDSEGGELDGDDNVTEDEKSENPVQVSGTQSTDTSDNQPIIGYIICLITALILLVVMLQRHKDKSEKEENSLLKLKRGMFLGVLLLIGFGITTLALLYQSVAVENNMFATGVVDISLNDDKPIFDEEMVFEPGMRVQKELMVQNDSTCDVYYRLYFENMEGELAEILEVTVSYDKDILYQGTAADMTSKKALGMLREGEDLALILQIHVPEECGNYIQEQTFTFDVKVDAVQSVNNLDKQFD